MKKGDDNACPFILPATVSMVWCLALSVSLAAEYYLFVFVDIILD